ncbi:hypothetical protein AVEN_84311-1 [Araneus ventricosus]|uniref:Uncharacterized protein n=1 Tax=Araneus ventricosus TaxID=182803 RepID=A0A4Y2TCK6_ARAVE|nr:hypothetical protein AVEN_84311-1 [Araneus ventricosus]
MPDKPSKTAVRRPAHVSKLEVFNKLSNFLDNNDDWQYLLSEEMLLHFRSVSDKLYSEKRLRKLLSRRYGITVLISTSMKCIENVVSFRPVASKI